MSDQILQRHELEWSIVETLTVIPTVVQMHLADNTSRWPHHFGALLFLLSALATAPTIAQADDAAVVAAAGEVTTSKSADAYGAGALAATGFAGTRLQGKGVPPGVDPVTKTIIDAEGITLRIYGLNTLQGPLAGQVVTPSVALQYKARDVGHVFALAFDNEPPIENATQGLYVAATSLFGLNIVGPDKDNDGEPDRLVKGAPGAKFAEGQFGPGPDGGPGSIWKIDRSTGAVGLFINLSSNGIKNSGAGIGGLAFDPKSRTLFASDLDTGLIHRLSVADKKDLGQFDYGVTARPLSGKRAVPDEGERLNIESPNFDSSKPSSWKITQLERRIDALAVHDGRLFFAVAEGPQIWSVGLEADGNFAADARFEAGVESVKPYIVTGLTFDAAGNMIVAQRAPVQNPADYSAFVADTAAQVLVLKPESPDDPKTPGRWLQSEPQEYAVGEAKDHRSGSGGVTLQYAYRADGTLDTASCNGTVVFSTDAIGPKLAYHGFQISNVDALLPASLPPSNSAFVLANPELADATARGYVGGLAALQVCDGGGGSLPVAFGEGSQALGGGSGGGTVSPPLVGADATPVEPPLVDDGAGGGGTTQSGPLLMVKEPATATCAENQSCSFKITITNTSNQPVPGPTISDDMSIGGVPFSKFKLDPLDASWTCIAAAAPGMQCSHADPIPANSSVDVTLTFTPDEGALKGGTELKNCASFAGAALAPAAPAKAPNLNLPPPPAPTGTNNGGLKVEMAPTKGACSPTEGDCEFKVTITNNTGADIDKQPLTVSSTLAVGTQSQAKNTPSVPQLPAGLACKPDGREFTCTDNALSLKPGQSTTFTVAYKVDTSEGGKASFVQNKTLVTLGPLSGEATAAVAFNEPVNVLPEPGAPDPQIADGGVAAVPACATLPISPARILVKKTGPAKCKPKGECDFSISVTNTTADLITGPIEIKDIIDLPGATLSDAAIPAPFTCDKGPPVSCRLQELKANETVALPLTFKFDAPAATKQVKNCATAAQLPLNAPGGPAAPAAPADPNKAGKDKKADLFLFQRKSLVRLASLKPTLPQSFAEDNGLVHLVGGGNNNGGIGFGDPNASKCLSWKWTGKSQGFSIAQSLGVTTSFVNLNKTADGQVTGLARYPFGNGLMWGKVTGTFTGTHFVFDVKWDDGQSNHYTGDIDDNGQVLGATRNSRGVNETFSGLKDHPHFACELNKACEDYAKAAFFAAADFERLKCGAVGPGRWSTNIREHSDWCMAQRGGSQVVTEAEERKKQLAQCRLIRDVVTQCETVAGTIFDVNDEMKKLKCKDADPNFQSSVFSMACRLNPPHAEEVLQEKRTALDTCKAQLAANGGAVGPAGGGGAGGPGPAAGGGAGAGDPVQAQADIPEDQCVVVQLDENAPEGGEQDHKGGGGKTVAIPGNPADQGNGLTIQKFAHTKTCSPGTACDFKIQVTAKGDAANHPVTVVDVVSNDNNGLDLANGGEGVPPPAPWTCVGGRCTHPGPVPAGGLALPFTVKIGPKATAKVLRNCASIDTAAPGAAPIQDKNLAAEPTCVEVPLGAPAAVKAGKLTLAKNPLASKCSPNGGGCDFVVSVSNPADAPEFNGQITFVDHVSAPDGTPFPNITLENNPVQQSDPGVIAPIGCKKDGNDVTCQSGPNAKIPPGKGLRISMSFKPGNGSVAKALKNCATLEGGEPQCVTIPFADGPLLRASKIASVAGDLNSCVPNCTFLVSLKNVGTGSAPGPIVIKDVFKAANGMDSMEVVAGDFACATTNGVIGCIANKPELEPGATLTGVFRFNVKTVSPEYNNCIEYDPAANAKPSPFDNDAANRCATLKDTAHAGANLLLELTPPNEGPDGVGKCSINAPCRFSMLVKSNGASTFQEKPSVIFNVLGGLAENVDMSPGFFGCGPKGNNPACTATVPDLASGNQLSGEVNVLAGVTWKKNDRLTLCGKFIFADPKHDTNPNDDRVCKTVVLDPFNVKVTKTGDASCAPGGDCHFTLTLFNPGPIPHNAPVTISDKLTGLTSAQIVSINPPLPCAAQPTSIPFTCTSPGVVPLPLGGPPKVFNMVVRLPNDASAAQFSNCASIAQDATSPGTEPSCVTVSTKPAAAATCTSGLQLVDGICVCPEPKHWTGRECVGQGAGGFNASAPGDAVPPPPSPVAVTPTPPPANAAKCSSGLVLIDSVCRCPEGSEWQRDKCVETEGSGGTNGTSMGNDDRPEPRPVPAQSNQRPQPEQPRCGPHSRLRNGECRCLQGFTQNRRGDCIPLQAEPTKQKPEPEQKPKPAPKPKCPDNAYFEDGACHCDDGFERLGRQCVPKRAVPKPPPAKERPPEPCPKGYTRLDKPNKYGALCEPPAPKQKCPNSAPEGTWPNCHCPAGTVSDGQFCRVEKCSPGMSGKPPNCHRICPNGTHNVNESCIPDQKPQPKPAPKPDPVGPAPQRTCGPGMRGTPPNCCSQDDWNPRTNQCEKFTRPK